jgi:4-amino-4-deoxy-L-arabinose transferase-like glycosyltransferase
MPIARWRDRWSRLERERRIAVLGLGGLVVAGVGLRLATMVAYGPALVGYPDSAVYITGARGDLFWDPLRVAGYSAFLRVVHAVNAELSFTPLVQHALGVGTALLLYATVRRVGGSPWVALVPAAIVLLGGDQVFFEHALLSETLYTFLTAAGVYAAARALGGAAAGWAAALGALLALAATVRLAGLVLIAPALLWLLLVPAERTRTRLLRAGSGAAAAAVVLLAYLVAAHGHHGDWTFARNGGYNFYGRAATFAECDEFDPPAGTEVLCEDTPATDRSSAQYYIFSGPAVRHFGEPQVGSPPPENVEKVTEFGRRAALAQPLDWLAAAGRDFTRYVSPGSFRPRDATPSAEEYVEFLLVDPAWVVPNLDSASKYWSTPRAASERRAWTGRLRDYASLTRLEGVPVALLLLLAIAAPFVRRGIQRRGALLLAGTALLLLVVPVFTINYDGRFAVPAYGFLGAAAALGAAPLLSAARTRLQYARSSSRTTAERPTAPK